MNILAIDTAYGSCAVTLKIGNSYFSRSKPGLHQQAELLLPLIAQVLKEAEVTLSQLTSLAFSAGPASFTGVRLALSTVQGLSLPHKLPVVGVNSLQALAQAFYDIHHHSNIAVCMNAYMGQLFWAGFTVNAAQNLQIHYPAALINPRELPLLDETWTKVGNGWKLCQLETEHHDFLPGSAIPVVHLAILACKAGLEQNAATIMPLYLRTATAWKKLTT